MASRCVASRAVETLTLLFCACLTLFSHALIVCDTSAVEDELGEARELHEPCAATIASLEARVEASLQAQQESEEGWTAAKSALARIEADNKQLADSLSAAEQHAQSLQAELARSRQELQDEQGECSSGCKAPCQVPVGRESN